MSFFDSPPLKGVLDFEWGLSFEQLRRVLPLLHVALSAAANAPNNAATWAILYDEMRALLSDELWPGRDSDKPPVHARAEVVDRARRDYKTHVASLFAMFYEDPVAAFFDLAAYILAHKGYCNASLTSCHVPQSYP